MKQFWIFDPSAWLRTGFGFSIGKSQSKKALCLTLCAMLLALCTSAEAQSLTNTPKIGWLGAGAGSMGSGRELFRTELRTLGYIEGKNIAFEYRSAGNNRDRLSAQAEELIRLNVAVLVMPSLDAALAAKKATTTMPIVFLDVSDPIGSGLIASLARPGGNITGFTTISTELIGKRLEILKETLPKLFRVAVLWDPNSRGSERSWKESQTAAQQLGLQLHSMEVSSLDKYEAAFEAAIKAGSGALVAPQNPLTSSNRNLITKLSVKYRLPTIYPRSDYVAGGGLMSYGRDQAEPYQRGAVMVDKILRGTKPADIPVEQPKKFEFVVNLKTAKQIGLTVPPNVLARADRVVR